jgi:hypothetical protein
MIVEQLLHGKPHGVEEVTAGFPGRLAEQPHVTSTIAPSTAWALPETKDQPELGRAFFDEQPGTASRFPAAGEFHGEQAFHDCTPFERLIRCRSSRCSTSH